MATVMIRRIADFIPGTGNAGYHNSIYRGKYLGDHVTAEQWAAIRNGTFDDMYIGDYWIIDGVTWRIAAFDYWFNFGDGSNVCNTHNIVIVPDEVLNVPDGSTTHWMNATDTTAGAYFSSDWRTGNNGNTGRADCINKINSAFGSGHILTYREYLTNAVSDGYQSAGTWYDASVEMMTEQMVYGGKVFSSILHGDNIPDIRTIGNSQLPLFRLNHLHICNRVNWWLRDVVSTTHFAVVFSSGNCNHYSAGSAWVGVRPAFGLVA